MPRAMPCELYVGNEMSWPLFGMQKNWNGLLQKSMYYVMKHSRSAVRQNINCLAYEVKVRFRGLFVKSFLACAHIGAQSLHFSKGEHRDLDYNLTETTVILLYYCCFTVV